MKALIKVTKQELFKEIQNTVDSRDLHESLGIASRHRDWINLSLESVMATENIDFELREFARYATGGKPQKVYTLTMDIAKEIAMIQKNQTGKDMGVVSVLHLSLSIKQECLFNFYTKSTYCT